MEKYTAKNCIFKEGIFLVFTIPYLALFSVLCLAGETKETKETKEVKTTVTDTATSDTATSSEKVTESKLPPILQLPPLATFNDRLKFILFIRKHRPGLFTYLSSFKVDI